MHHFQERPILKKSSVNKTKVLTSTHVVLEEDPAREKDTVSLTAIIDRNILSKVKKSNK